MSNKKLENIVCLHVKQLKEEFDYFSRKNIELTYNLELERQFRIYKYKLSSVGIAHQTYEAVKKHYLRREEAIRNERNG